MIDGLVSGKLHAKPTQRTGPSGKQFCTAKLMATDEAGERQFINAIAFDQTAQAALLALDGGDAVSIAGALSVKVYVDKQGIAKPSLSIVAHAVLSVYHVHRKRRAMQSADDKTQDFLTHEREYP